MVPLHVQWLLEQVLVKVWVRKLAMDEQMV